MIKILSLSTGTPQSAFVAGRHITDNVMVSFECFHSLITRRKSKGSMALKLDVSKAYDRVEWRYLDAIMEKLGFCSQWRHLIMQCVTTVRFSVMVNGNLSSEFAPSCGIRQGDPISPYLFLLCAEGFSCLLKEAEHNKKISGIKPSFRGPVVSHLLFADDSLIFTRATVHEAQEVKQLLERYELLSGQSINRDKSVVRFSPCVKQETRAAIKDILGLQSMAGIDKYLGLPSVIGRSKAAVFELVKQKVWKKAHSWKGRFFSKAGKEVMLKFVLQSIPVYVMGVFRLPAGLCDSILSILRKFWWSNKEGGRYTSWQSWGDLCKPKDMGGLGFRDIKDFNSALLAKQGWKVIQSPHSLVGRILKAKYFPHSDFFRANLGPNPSYVWRSLLSARNLLRDGGIWRIGDGWDVDVWQHAWLPHRPGGKLVGPAPLTAAATRVGEFIDPSTSSWNVDKVLSSFTETDAADILKVHIPAVPRGDKLCWPGEKFGEYSVKSGYRWLRGTMDIDSDIKKLYQFIWRGNLPPKLKHFGWRVSKQILPTAAALSQKKILESSICPVCGIPGEDINHALVWCGWARNVWPDLNLTSCPSSFIADNCVMEWMMHQVRCNDRLLLEQGLIIMWLLWYTRNQKVFKGTDLDGRSIPARAASFWQQLAHAAVTRMDGVRRSEPKWQPPGSGQIKLNCDGSFKSSGSGGIGAVIRDGTGKVLGALAAPILHCVSVLEMEAEAIKAGLLFAREHGYHILLVETDASELVAEILRQQESTSLHGHVIEDIKMLASSFDLCSFSFIPRQCNMVADRLATIGSTLSQPLYWTEEPPDCITDVLFLDL